MDEMIISAQGLKQVFKVRQREKTSFLSVLKSLLLPKYVDIEVLAGINFNVNKGEIHGLIGPNGSGKSTVIKILCGILYPTAGNVRVMGYTPWQAREEYLRNIGVVFGQKTQLWWDLPPIDTFSLNQKMYRIPKTLYNENLEYFKDLLGIGEVITRPTRQLSLGERMKCDLVCAMLHEPKVVFLDEPGIGLDLQSKESIRGFIKQANRQKKTTFIITTHDLAEIEDLCENITIINKGSIVYNGTLGNMKTLITRKKIMEIQFKKPVTRDMLIGFHVLEFNPMNAVIEIEPEQNGIQIELANIISTLPVQDININDISIEEIVKQIYSAWQHQYKLQQHEIKQRELEAENIELMQKYKELKELYEHLQEEKVDPQALVSLSNIMLNYGNLIVKNLNSISNIDIAPDFINSVLEIKFTRREQDVLRLIGHGYDNAGIAKELMLAEGSVVNLVVSIRAKLAEKIDINDRMLAVYAVYWSKINK